MSWELQCIQRSLCFLPCKLQVAIVDGKYNVGPAVNDNIGLHSSSLRQSNSKIYSTSSLHRSAISLAAETESISKVSVSH